MQSKLDVSVSVHLLPYIINGDGSGTDEHDLQLFDRFQDDVIAKHGKGHWYLDSDDNGFGMCRVIGLASNLCIISWMVNP